MNCELSTENAGVTQTGRVIHLDWSRDSKSVRGSWFVVKYSFGRGERLATINYGLSTKHAGVTQLVE